MVRWWNLCSFRSASVIFNGSKTKTLIRIIFNSRFTISYQKYPPLCSPHGVSLDLDPLKQVHVKDLQQLHDKKLTFSFLTLFPKMKLAICVGHLSTHVFESWKIYVFLMGGDETFGKWLKDGRVLCSVANKIQPGAAREGGRGMEESWYLLQGTDISPPRALLSRWFFHSQSGIMVVSRKVSDLMGTFIGKYLGWLILYSIKTKNVWGVL